MDDYLRSIKSIAVSIDPCPDVATTSRYAYFPEISHTSMPKDITLAIIFLILYQYSLPETYRSDEGVNYTAYKIVIQSCINLLYFMIKYRPFVKHICPHSLQVPLKIP